MKAKTKSAHAWLYRFTYKSNLPKNLCPYFWKLIFAGAIFIPNFILQFPLLVFGFFDRDAWKEDCGGKRTYGFAFYFVAAILSVYSFFTYHWIKWVFDCYSYNHENAGMGGFLNLVIACIVLYFLIKSAVKWLRYRNRKDEYAKPAPSLVVEFMKAKYHRYCPQIEWDKNPEDEA